MTNFFETENLDTANSGLRDHQQDAFNDIIESLSQGQKSGFVEMATGSGKTAIISKLAELYITNSQSKVVILAPSVPICQQIQQEIIKHTKISDSSITFLYQGQTIDPDADIIISTYQSFVSKGTDFDEVGLMLADECHRSLGPITSKVVKHSYPNSYKIGFSATPSFRANRRSEELFGQPMHKLSLGDAIESGVTQPVEAFVYKTGAELSLNDASDNDFTYSELEPLMNNAARNRAGIDLAKELVASGRQGIVNCIAGKSNAHARALAEILSGSTVLMPNGQTRKIIAKSVGNHLTKQEQTAILEDYEAGKIDVLTFTKALEEGWDSQRASFAINLRPTTSELKIKQLLGRILRKKTEDSRPSIYIDLIDKTEQYKPIYTGLHALDFRDGQGTGSNLDTTDRQYASSKTETSKKDTNYKALVLSQYLLEQIITTKSEIDQFERLSQARKASNILSKEQFRELREIVSPSYDPTFYRHNMKLIKNPPRLSPANQDLLYLEELSSYAEQLAEQQQNDGELNSLFVGAGSELDELTNRLAEITEGHSLPKHMARILFLHSGYFQTDSYTTDDHAPAPQQALSPERHAEKVLLEEQLKSVLDTLSEREAGIIRMRYGFYTGQPATLNEIGKTYGLSRERIRMIEYLAMRKLRHPSRSEELQDYRDDYTYSIDERVFKPLTRREAEDKKRSHYEKKLLEEAGILSRSSKHEVTPEALKWAANLISRLPEKLSESGPLYSLQALFNTWQSDFHVAVINEVFKSHASYNHINKRTVIERLAEFLEPEQHNQLVAELASGVSEKTLLSAEILKGEDYLLLNRQQLGLFLGIKPRHFALLIKSIPEIDSPLSTTQRTKYSPSEIYKIIENLKYRGVISQNNTGVFETNYAHLYASLIKQAKKDEAKIEALNKILSDSKG